MERRKIDLVVATGEDSNDANNKFQKKLTKKINKGWYPNGEKSIKQVGYNDESVYMIYQIIKRD